MKKNNAVIIRIELCDVKPIVWRQVRVPLDFSLAELHDVVQIAMGWMNGHLHQFWQGDQCIGMLDEDAPDDMVDEYEVSVGEIFAKKNIKLKYEYDFGDGWEHVITSQELIHSEDNRPSILAGKSACPPEDCGGPYGYEHLREVIADPNHDEHEEMIEWLGGSFDPARFDIEEANAVLYESTDGYGATVDTEEMDLEVFSDAYDATQRPDPER